VRCDDGGLSDVRSFDTCWRGQGMERLASMNK
jgi:hypothetical protein